MKYVRLYILSVALVCGASVNAGSQGAQTVVIDKVNKYVYGDLSGARNSGDNIQEIGCQFASEGLLRVNCYATASDLTSAYCSTSDPSMISVAQSMSNDGSLRFFYDDYGYCVFIAVNNASFTPPKDPDAS